MKAGIHPEYGTALITCACGRVTETSSTVGEIHVEICSHCHPFFTGRQKLVDTAGRVERFRAKYGEGSTPAVTEAEAEEPAAEAEEEEPVAEAEAEQPAGEAEEPAAEADPVADDEAAPAGDAEEDDGEEEELADS